MKKFECPHCGEKTISPIKKAFAGNQKSKGVVCPKCGGHCTNDMKSAVFHTITDFIMLVFVIIFYFAMPSGTNFFTWQRQLLLLLLLTELQTHFSFPLRQA